MTYSIIKKAQLEGAHRLDAEYFQPLYLELEQKLKEAHLVTIKNLGLSVDASAFYPSISQYYKAEGEIPFVRVADVFSTRLIEDGLLFLPKIIVNQFKTIRIGKPGDIIITKGGTIGNAALLPNTYSEYALSRDIIYIKSSRLSEEQRISLLLFLNSRLGMLQLIRGASQQVQAHLTFPIIRELLVPKVPIKDAVSLYNESFKAETASISFYRQAENLLLEKLGLKDFQIQDDLSFIVNLSGVKGAGRVDVEYFQPKYEKILQRLKNKNIDTLEKHFQILRGKNFTYSKDGEIGIIKTKQLGKQFVSFEVEDWTDSKTIKKENLPTIEDSDVIFASMGVGSLGKVNIYYTFEAERDFTIDSTLRIFRSKNSGILPEALTVYLSSQIGLELIYKYVVGSSGIISIYDNYLRNFPIPVLPKETQQKIADLVRKSHEARKKSKELLEEAKRKIEEMIERGEK